MFGVELDGSSETEIGHTRHKNNFYYDKGHLLIKVSHLAWNSFKAIIYIYILLVSSNVWLFQSLPIYLSIYLSWFFLISLPFPNLT